MILSTLSRSRLLMRTGGLVLASSLVLLSGCANMSTTALEGNSFSTAGTMTGKIHGGHLPVRGATVTLYAVGTTGYGTGSTLLATTTSASDDYGSFQFTQVTSGATGPTGNTYICPSSSALIYLISSGGNTDGVIGDTNSAAVFLAALGACGSVGNVFVDMNEITSAASIFALAQYINPGTTPGTATVGSPNTAQAIQGLTNAFAVVPNLTTLSSGTVVTSFTPTAASGATGVTTTGTPEYAKLTTIANALASCVNNASSAGTNCTTLFTNAVPPSPAVTSQPSATFGTAQDTLQAAYYMATNPSDGGPTALTNIFNLAAPNPPFQTGLTLVPSDWNIGITYTFGGSCTNASSASFLSSAESIAIDATGNVWFNNGATGATNALSEISPTGTPKVCAFGTIASGRGLTIDTTGNVWTTSSTTGTTTGVYEYLAGGTTLTWPTTVGANGIVADGNGNIFFAPSGSATPFQEYVSAASASTTSASQSVGGNVTSSTALLFVPMDTSSRIWAAGANSAVLYDVYPGGTTPTNGYSSVDAGTASATTAVINNGYGGAIDASGNIFGGSTCCAATASNTFFKLVPGATAGTLTGTISAKYAGGLVAPRSTAVDGAGNVWAGMGYPVYTAATSPTAVAIYALAEVDNNMNSISYAGTTPATCSSTGSNCPTSGGYQKTSLGTVRSLAIDPSGNVWAASNGTVQSIIEYIGAAVPVVTPLAVGIKNSTLGTKP